VTQRLSRARVATVTLFWVVGAAACAQAPLPRATGPRPDPAVLQELHDVYSFTPHQLTNEQQVAEGKVLDRLWTEAAQQPDRYLPALRAELAADRQLPFFYFDAGSLLVKVSRDPADHAIALAALARTDLRDISQLSYVRAVNGFARDGLDTSAAAFKILSDPAFTAYVPAHALELHHGDSLRFMLLPSASAAIGAAVVARYPSETTEAAKKALLLVAFDLAPDGDALLRRVAADPKEPEPVRAYAQAAVKGMSDVAAARDVAELMALITGSAPVAKLPEPEALGLPKTVSEVLAMRRRHAGPISDEALSDIEFDTMLLRMYLARDARAAAH
jgi:hypothetical protein